MSSQFSRRRARALTTVTALAAVALLASGCSSSSGTPASSTPASTGGSTPSTSSSASGLAASVAAAELPPTTIPLTTPLTSKPPTGKTIIYAKCDAPSCTQIGQGISDAAAAVGWTYKAIPYKDADPATLTAAMRQALDLKPSAVAVGGVPPESGWGTLLPQYKAAGIPIIANYLGSVKYDETLIANIGGGDSFAAAAKLAADWFTVDSKGAGVALLQRVDDFPVLKAWADGFAAEVTAVCPGCKMVELKNTIPDVFGGKVVSSTVSALQRNPNATYLASCDLEFFDGLSSALSAAGLNGKIKVVGNNPTVAIQTALKGGALGAGTPQALQYSGWVTVDVAIRHMEGMTVDPTGGGLPTQLLVAGGSFTPGPSYNMPADYQAQLKKLWLL